MAFLLVVLVASGFFYYNYQATCALPKTYRVGTVDERFNLSRVEARAVVEQAVATWEDSLKRDVFASVREDADFTINFIFDERQARADREAREREHLDAVEARNAKVQKNYHKKVEKLNAQERAYHARGQRYDQDLARYNQTVKTYNASGGVPEATFVKLKEQRKHLQAEAKALDQDLVALNELVAEINQLGEQGNVLISRFNNEVDRFNDSFADGREFTQGDWRGDRINIYSFSDLDELHVVLVHELGHALGVAHVADPTAYMYFLLGAQDPQMPLRPDDVAAFRAVCSDEARLATVPQPWRTVFSWFVG